MRERKRERKREREREKSLRRTVTAHARNMGIDSDIVKANTRWRIEFGSKTGASRLDMTDVCTSLESLIPALLQFSRGL